MKRRTATWIGASCLGLLVVAFVGGSVYDRYGRWSAKRVATCALEGFGRAAVPNDVDLELEAQNPEQVAAALRAGFKVDVVDNILWSFRSFELAVQVSDGSTLQCDLYHTPKWSLRCWPVTRSQHAV
jgi:hypothetical protein